ncbi:MAG: hypothetical protein LBQ66_02265 [Planctomycetaceae bacterium]|nr:hypothetical protein [Planctomycetaceae bacterium]
MTIFIISIDASASSGSVDLNITVTVDALADTRGHEYVTIDGKNLKYQLLNTAGASLNWNGSSVLWSNDTKNSDGQ